MNSFKPVKQPRISEQVLRQLKEAILLGGFKSGEKLPSERELTDAFHVSRGVIREAIRALEITGFVVTRQGPTGGAFVTELSFDHLGNAFLDLFLSNRVSIPEMAHVRHFIEPEVARLAALNITKEGVERLMHAQDAEYLPVQNNSERITIMQKTHLVLAEICANHFLEAISKSMLKLTKEIVEAVDPDHEALHGPGEHGQVIQAVMVGKASDAASAMSEHLDKFCERLIKMEEVYRQKTAWGSGRVDLKAAMSAGMPARASE
jgi:GntR family transcriptional repressor for pyruvate dehydrogenase complex